MQSMFENICLHDGDSFCFITEHHKCIVRLNIKHLSGGLWNQHLPMAVDFNSPEDMFSFGIWRQYSISNLAFKFYQLVNGRIIQLCQFEAAFYIRDSLTLFLFCISLSGNADFFGNLLLRIATQVPQQNDIVTQYFLFHPLQYPFEMMMLSL